MPAAAETFDVLYVAPDREVTGRIAGALEDDDERFAVTTVTTASEGRSRLADDRFDCVLSAYELPETNGIELFETVRDRDPDLPFVVLAADGSEPVAAEALSAGVTDYVERRTDSSRQTLLATRLRNAILAQRAAEATDGAASSATADADPQGRSATPAVDSSGPSERHQHDQPFRALVEKSNDIISIVDSAGCFQYVSPTMEQVLGHDPGELLGTEAWAYIHPEDREDLVELFEAAVATGASAEAVKYRFRGADDSWRWLRSYSNNQLDNPEIEGYVVNSRDITDQHTRQRQLQREKQTVESIFTALPDVLYTFDLNGYLLRWNDQLEAETGYSSDELEEMYVTDFVPNDEVETIAERFQTIIEDQRSVTVESAFERKDGTRVPFEFTGAPLEDTDGGLRGVTGIGRNISGRKKQQRRFEAVFNNTYQFTGLMRPDGTLLEVNKTAAEFADRAPESLVGQKIWDAHWFQANEMTKEVAKRSVETASAGEFFQEQITVQGGDREIVIDFSVRPVTDETGAVDLLIPEGRDITRIVEQKQQFEVTNRFLRHNIRNSLNTIIGHGELVQQADDDRLRASGESIVEVGRSVTETADTAREIHTLIGSDPTLTPTVLETTLTEAAQQARANYPNADITVDAGGATEIMGLPSLDRAFAQLLVIVLADASESPTARVSVDRSNTATVAIASPDGGPLPVERKVLTGDIEVGPLEHAQGLDVWYVYWHVRFCGGDIEIDDAGDVRVHLPLMDGD